MDRIARVPLLAALLLAGSARADDAREVFFELKVRPILAGECFPCHGGKKTSGALRVDTRAALLKGGDRGPAIVVGDAAQSLLLQAINHQADDVKMPPGRQLPNDARSAIGQWIADGAVWPAGAGKSALATDPAAARHWAFERVKHVEPPPDPARWSERPVDRFIASGHRAARLEPVGPADKRTLIRRLTFDLIGLPPTPAEVADFLADDSPEATTKLVERLLASPHYGERWGRYWMDVVRYADTAGDNADYPVPESVLYRKYIIDSFNQDRPYDRFVREQVAGDVLARSEHGDEYARSIVATGFLAQSRRYATGPYELWHLTIEDAIDTTGRAFLGLTFRCARCHDHKFDPVSQRDYYALYGVFASTAFPYAGSEELHSKQFPRKNFVPLLPPAEAKPKLAAFQEKLAGLERAAIAAGSARDQAKGALELEIARLKRPSLPADLPGAYAVTEGEPVDAPLQRRGDPANPGDPVPRGAPRFGFLAGNPPAPVAPRSSGRLELANWLTDPTNPLTSRVIVNRVWQRHFGRGIVTTASNFGIRGEPPTHPELLDWLAARLIEGGWSIKAIHREIVLSATYQLSSDFESHNDALDPGNRWLWRYPRRRLDAEAIRDAMLAVSGGLDPSPGRGHPFPPMEQWQWTQHNAFKAVYPSNRRSVYLMTQRLVKHPFLAIFDGPDTNTSTEARAESTVPLQALFLMNNPFVQQSARGLAARLCAATKDDRARVALGHELAWGRPPSPPECAQAIAFIEAARSLWSSRSSSPAAAEEAAWASLAKVFLTSNEFLYVD